MDYYEEDFFDSYSDYDNNDYLEPVDACASNFSEKFVGEVLAESGFVSETTPIFCGSMEKMVFLHGIEDETYSSLEIKFIEQIKEVYIYPDVLKYLYNGKMLCRTIAAKIDSSGISALKDCVYFEKIVNKAFDGFNIFVFFLEDGVSFGSRVYGKLKKRSFAISKIIRDQEKYEQIINDFSEISCIESFYEYYNLFNDIILESQNESEDYDQMIARRQGLNISYIEDMDQLEHDIGLSLTKEKLRYINMFDEREKDAFSSILEDIDEGLAFIKSNRVNTYEMMFEADEYMHQAQKTEAENERISKDTVALDETNIEIDESMKEMLDNPEEMIKMLKKRRIMK